MIPALLFPGGDFKVRQKVDPERFYQANLCRERERDSFRAKPSRQQPPRTHPPTQPPSSTRLFASISLSLSPSVQPFLLSPVKFSSSNLSISVLEIYRRARRSRPRRSNEILDKRSAHGLGEGIGWAVPVLDTTKLWLHRWFSPGLNGAINTSFSIAEDEDAMARRVRCSARIVGSGFRVRPTSPFSSVDRRPGRLSLSLSFSLFFCRRSLPRFDSLSARSRSFYRPSVQVTRRRDRGFRTETRVRISDVHCRDWDFIVVWLVVERRKLYVEEHEVTNTFWNVCINSWDS